MHYGRQHSDNEERFPDQVSPFFCKRYLIRQTIFVPFANTWRVLPSKAFTAKNAQKSREGRQADQNLVRPALRSAIPSMLLQFREQIPVERPGVTGRNVLSHVLRLAHAGNGRAHGGMRQDEAQRHLRQRHSGGKNFFQFVDALDRLGEIFRTEISGAPVVFGKGGLERHLAAQAAFVEWDAGDYAYVKFLADGKKFVFRGLIEDVVDHLHRIHQAGAECPNAILRLPAVDAQAEEADCLVALQFLHGGAELRFGAPGVVPDVELQEIDRIHAQLFADEVGVLENVLRGENVAVLIFRQRW